MTHKEPVTHVAWQLYPKNLKFDVSFLIYKNENDKGELHSYQVIWFAFANITGEVAPSKTLYAVFPQGFA